RGRFFGSVPGLDDPLVKQRQTASEHPGHGAGRTERKHDCEGRDFDLPLETREGDACRLRDYDRPVHAAHRRVGQEEASARGVDLRCAAVLTRPRVQACGPAPRWREHGRSVAVDDGEVELGAARLSTELIGKYAHRRRYHENAARAVAEDDWRAD